MPPAIPAPPLFCSTTCPPRGRGDGRGFLAAEPAERSRVVTMDPGCADAEGEARLRDAEDAGGGGVLVGLLAGLLGRGRKGTLRFGVVLDLGFALVADEGVGRLVAGDAGGILDALLAPPGGTNLRGSSSGGVTHFPFKARHHGQSGAGF